MGSRKVVLGTDLWCGKGKVVKAGTEHAVDERVIRKFPNVVKGEEREPPKPMSLEERLAKTPKDGGMTVAQMRELADEQGIDLDGASKRSEIVERILAAHEVEVES